MQKESLGNKLKNWFGGMLDGGNRVETNDDYEGEDYMDEYEDDQVYDEIEEEEVEEEEYRRPQARIHNMRPNRKFKMQIIKPTSTDSAKDILILLKSKTAVIVNMESLNKEDSRSILDYISGGIFALDGQIQKVTNAIFLATPYDGQIITSKKQNYNLGIDVPWSNQK